MTRRFVDLSHTITEGLVTYPGLPAPTFEPHLTRENSKAVYAEGTEFRMDIIRMIGNTGTYLDSPFHRYSDGGDLSTLALETLVDIPAVVFQFPGLEATEVDGPAPEDQAEPGFDGRGITADAFGTDDLRGTAVLLSTGWDALFGTPAYAEHSPYLSEDGARELIERGVVLVGIDSLNIDDTEATGEHKGERPAHTLLLDAGIHVVEHLTNLTSLPFRGARFTAVPPKVVGFGTFPVRAFATVDAE
ncbi:MULTISPECIES: cyclase family protein [Subtercola]|uniref:Cyclase family protein n=1 Tax=Subtercola vilae TaxID=2056433 RepID=A0A4T2BHR4_9MICO|nr:MULTISPECIES: cyclase family protein [Subtercola]MEA9986650.1 cyclase family protein [Subtercola sp. RTI3]TIH30239.1 cyclase family protein [Subtercola vilae]